MTVHNETEKRCVSYALVNVMSHPTTPGHGCIMVIFWTTIRGCAFAWRAHCTCGVRAKLHNGKLCVQFITVFFHSQMTYHDWPPKSFFWLTWIGLWRTPRSQIWLTNLVKWCTPGSQIWLTKPWNDAPMSGSSRVGLYIDACVTIEKKK